MQQKILFLLFFLHPLFFVYSWSALFMYATFYVGFAFIEHRLSLLDLVNQILDLSKDFGW
jgi:hypothetical protein